MSAEIVVAASTVTAALACIEDLRSRRIPNQLTFGSAGLAFATYLLVAGSTGLASSAAGWTVGCALFLPIFLLKGMGAGDVKLLAAIGAWVGPTKIVWVALYGALAGGLLALVVLLNAGVLRPALENLGYLFAYWRTVGVRPVPTLTLTDAKSPKLPYAVPIAAGLMVTLWLR